MIAIVLLTAVHAPERAEYARRTLASLRYLNASEELWLHIADDGSPQEFRDEMLARAHEQFIQNVSISNSRGEGYGANYNLASQQVHSIADVILPLEDDWEMMHPFDVSPIARVLRDGVFGCVRMGYIGCTQRLQADFVKQNDLWWLRLDPDSAEPHIFAGHPRMEHVSWQQKVGPWPLSLSPGETEFAVAHRREARLDVAWPVDLIPPSGPLFAHIGTVRSY